MKRILILTILLMSSLAWAGSTTVVVGQGGGAGGGDCVGGSDGALGENGAIYGSPGGQCSSPCTTSYLYVQLQTPVEDGTVSYIHWDTFSAGGYTRAGIWDTDGVLLASCSQQSGTNNAPDTFDKALDEAECLAAGTSYYIGIWIQADAWSGIYLEEANEGSNVMYIAMETFGNFTPGNLASNSGATLYLRAWADNSAGR